MFKRAGLVQTALLGASMALLLSGTAALAQQSKPAAPAANAAAAPAQSASAPPEATAQPLNENELEVLVSRIALYPDQLVGLVASASLFPLQVVEAQRYLTEVKTNPDLQPKSTWDGSIVALLNYPEVVKMMSDDLDWTQSMQQAITNQQADVLMAIQQLREKAVADNILKSDDKVKVVEEGGNIEILPASADNLYIPNYAPEMLYQTGYPPAPIEYYSESYPNYWYPTAPYYPALITGLAWASIVDWGDNDIWGGPWDGGNFFINCNRCIIGSDFVGRINVRDVDWRNVDRNRIQVDRSELNRIDRTAVENGLRTRDVNNLQTKAADLRAGRDINQERAAQMRDVREGHLGANLGTAAAAGAAGAAAANLAQRRPEAANRAQNLAQGKGAAANRAQNLAQGKGTAANRAQNLAQNKGTAAKQAAAKKGQAVRTGGKKKPGAATQNRTRQPSAMGEVRSGQRAQMQSTRGYRSMGGGQRYSATPHRTVSMSRGGGGGRSFSGGGGGRGGFGGGGGRGGGGGGGRGRR